MKQKASKANDTRVEGIPDGTEISVFCPACHLGLNRFDPGTRRVWISLKTRVGRKEGKMELAPQVPGFQPHPDHAPPAADTIRDINCPHCDQSLLDTDHTCPECNGLALGIHAAIRQRVVRLFACFNPECQWFGIDQADEQKIRPTLERQKKPEQDALLRIHNFHEVSYGFNRELAIAEANRCLDCKKPRCVEGCPVGIDIPAFIRLIREGKFLDAARKIKEKNALPAICGRVCPQEDQCEKMCVLGIKGEPVAIGNLERFVADFERETDSIQIPKRPDPTGKRIAVVGSGPAGLTLAADMCVRGHDVTVYEALHQPGGVLVYGIPEFRLPKSIVAAEIDYLRRLGVKIELNTIVGRLYTIKELFENGFDAVFVGTGAGLPVFTRLPGENLCNILSANEYLTRVNLMKAYAFPEYDTPAPLGRQVVVIGGGNVAMDCARTALRMGSREVTVLYRRTREQMPAREEEIHHAEQEGIRFRFLTSPVRFTGDERNWLRQVECVQMKLGDPDASGRPRPIPAAGSNFLLDTDMALIAVGAGPNPVLFSGCPELKTTSRGYIDVICESGRCNTSGVWSGGDIVTGSATVIQAMGAARKAADDMHDFLNGGGQGAWTAPAGT